MQAGDTNPPVRTNLDSRQAFSCALAVHRDRVDLSHFSGDRICFGRSSGTRAGQRHDSAPCNRPHRVAYRRALPTLRTAMTSSTWYGSRLPTTQTPTRLEQALRQWVPRLHIAADD